MTTQLLDTEIVYDRETRDYAVKVCGVIVGFGRTYSEAEAVRTRVLAERLTDGCYHTATLLDGGALDPDPEPIPPPWDRALIPAADWGTYAHDDLNTCGCGARSIMLLHGVHDTLDIPLCGACHAAYDSVLAATDRARERVLRELDPPDGEPGIGGPDDIPGADPSPGRSALAVA